MSPRDLSFIIFYKIHILMGVFFTALIIVGVYTFFSPRIYLVSSTVLLKPLIDSRQLLQTNKFSVDPVSQEDINTEIELMMSKELMVRVVNKLDMVKTQDSNNQRKQSLFTRLGLKHEPSTLEKAITDIRNGLDIEAVSMSNMIHITKTGIDPAEITKIVNTLLDCYVDLHIEAHKNIESVAFYTAKTSYYNQTIHSLEDKFKKFLKKLSIIDIEQQKQINIQLLQKLRESLTYTLAQIAEKDTRVSQLNMNMIQQGEITLKTEEYRQSEVLIELRKGYVPLLVEKKRIEQLYPKTSVEYQDTHNQTKQFKMEIVKEQREILQGLNVDLSALQSKKSAIELNIKQIKTESELLAQNQIEQDRLTRKIQRNKKNYHLYMDKLEEVRITEQRDTAKVANVFVSNRAMEPSMPTYPKVKLSFIIAVIAGLIAGLGATFAAYYLDHTVKRSEELERLSGIPVLSSLVQYYPHLEESDSIG